MSLLFAVVATVACADTEYFVATVQGARFFYSVVDQRPDQYRGQPATRESIHTVTEALQGDVQVSAGIDEVEWTDPNGRVLRSTVTDNTGKDREQIDAVFGQKTVEVTREYRGVRSHHSIRIPQGRLESALFTFAIGKKLTPGQDLSYWSLDTATFSFNKVQAQFVGRLTISVRGVKVRANLIETTAQQRTSQIYLDADGDILQILGPVPGVEVHREPKEIALAKPGKDNPSADLSELMGLKTDKPIKDPDHLIELKLRISGADFTGMPSNSDQTVTRSGDAWDVDVHPLRFDPSEDPAITALPHGYERWLKPSRGVPSDNRAFQELATRIVAGKKDVIGASTAIVDYVFNTITFKSETDAARDAAQILKTKTGVCRDYAVLALTLLRATDIPSREVVGWVYDSGAFYSHVWDEVWDGRYWIGIDPTWGTVNRAAEYIVWWEGNEEAMHPGNYPFGAKISVVSTRP